MNEKELMLEAVRKNGVAIYNASDRLKDDKEVVLAAVNEFGKVLQVASDRLKDDAEVVLTAIKRTRELRSDDEITIFNTKDETIVEMASPRIQELCKDRDPVKVLESMVMAEQLQDELTNKAEPSFKDKYIEDFAKQQTNRTKSGSLKI